jgi:hypothetical protein
MASTLPASLPPRLLTREQAAEYCGVSPNHFDQHCDVQPIRFGRRALFDRMALDEWIDKLQGRGERSQPGKKGLRSPRHVVSGEAR